MRRPRNHVRLESRVSLGLVAVTIFGGNVMMATCIDISFCRCPSNTFGYHTTKAWDSSAPHKLTKAMKVIFVSLQAALVLGFIPASTHTQKGGSSSSSLGMFGFGEEDRLETLLRVRRCPFHQFLLETFGSVLTIFDSDA